VLAAYVVPGAVVWASLGLGVGALALAAPWLGIAATIAAALYGCGYGAIEVCGLPWPAAPGRRWQVPQNLLIGVTSRRRVVVWGFMLGPGFLTRNPYAGFGVLPLLVAAAGRGWVVIISAGLVGMAHAAGRGAALLRDVARQPDEPFALLLRSLRWRVVDGLALLVVAAAAATVVLAR
jgi:hypothetical protein